MICESCPLSTDEPCGLYETHAINDKDGYCRCNVPMNRIRKLDNEYNNYLGNMGTDMGIEMECERLGIELSDIIAVAEHMVGLDYHEPYHRHGRAYYKAYRNYYDAPQSGNKYLDALPEGLVTKDVTERSVLYKLTDEGLAWLGRQLDITIKED